MNTDYTYDVAISFAEEDRNAALALALAFELRGFKNVYYYPNKLEATVGEELKKKLLKIYMNEARYSVILISDYYFIKEFTRIELNAISLRIEQNPESVYVIPVKLDESISLNEFSYLKDLTSLVWDYKPKEIVDILIKKLGTKNKKNDKKQNKGLHQSNKIKIIGSRVEGEISQQNNNDSHK